MFQNPDGTAGKRTYWQHGDFIENARPNIIFDYDAGTFELEVNLYYRHDIITGTFYYDETVRIYYCTPVSWLYSTDDYELENFTFADNGTELVFFVEGRVGFIGATSNGDVFYADY